MAKVPAKTGSKGPGTSVATQDEKSTALANTIDESILLGDSQNVQGFNVEDLAIPRLVTLQSNSPQVTKADPAYIKGALAGQMFITGLGDVYEAEESEDASVLFVPSYFTPSYLEWGLRESANRGLKKDWGAVKPDVVTTKDDKNRDIMPNGNQLVRQALYYGLFMANAEAEPIEVAFPLTSTQIKKARAWNSKMSMLRARIGGQLTKPALWYKAYTISTVPEKNDKGAWMGVKIEYGPDTLSLPDGKEIYLRARAFAESVQSGKVKVKHEEPVDAEIVTQGTEEEEVPF